jgi:hypothetical protein
MRILSGVIVAGWFLAAAMGVMALERHAGLVVEVQGQEITIEEMGPWLGPDTKPVRRAFQLTATTKVARVEREPEGSQGWRKSYVTRPAELSDLRPGDYVTVTIDPRESRNVAIEVQAVRPGPNALN